MKWKNVYYSMFHFDQSSHFQRKLFFRFTLVKWYCISKPVRTWIFSDYCATKWNASNDICQGIDLDQFQHRKSPPVPHCPYLFLDCWNKHVIHILWILFFFQNSYCIFQLWYGFIGVNSSVAKERYKMVIIWHWDTQF